MTMTVGARSLDNEERSNFRDYMSLLSLSVDASMTVREVMAVAYLIGRRDALRDVRNASSPARTVNRRLIHGGPSDCVFNRGYEADAGRTDPWTDQVDASRGEYVGDGVPRTFNGEPFEPLSGYPTPGAAPAPADPAAPDFLSTPSDFTTGNAR